MIDTHTHFYDKRFNSDRQLCIQHAIDKGINQFILPCVDSTSFAPMMAVCKQFPDCCFPSVGLHPTSVKEGYLDELAFMKNKLDSNQFVAIGEIGIDCYWSLDHIEAQRHAFRIQIEWAKTYALPIIIHARDSFHEIFPILDELHDERCWGVFHSFAGNQADFDKIATYGNFMIGVGGILTYKKSHLPEIIANVPLSNILLETDAPYLPPQAYRGKRNESAYMKDVAEKIAELKGVSLSEVDQQTTLNTNKVFGLLSPINTKI